MRLKIVAGNLAVVVLLGLIAYVTVSGQLRAQRTNELEAALDHDRLLFDRSMRLSALEFEAFVAARAAQRQMTDIFGGLDLDSRRTRAFEAAEATHAWLSDPARGGRGAPDIVVVVDETGQVIARDGARNVMFGKALVPTLPSLGVTLKTGTTRHDVWLDGEQNKLLQTAMAPIRRSDTGTVLGALIVGYDLSNGLATSEAKLLGRDIAFIVEGKVYSSSLDVAGARDLRAFVFGPNNASTHAVLTSQNAATQEWRTTLGGQDYTGITARLPMSPSVPVAFAVLGNRTQAMQAASSANIILVMLVLGALLVVAYGAFVGNSIMRPIEEIEEGILAVINGKTDLRLETTNTELGGLAFRINQLLNVLTGTEETSEDDEGKLSVPPSEGHWKDAAFSDARAGQQPQNQVAAANADADDVIDDPAIADALAQESEAAYNERIYREYVAAKQSVGENVSNIPKDRFAQRLKGRADALVQKHGCRMVRFQVSTENEQVVLRPVVIR